MKCPNCQASLESYDLKCKFCEMPIGSSCPNIESSAKGEVRLGDSQADMEASAKGKGVEKKRLGGVTVLGWILIFYFPLVIVLGYAIPILLGIINNYLIDLPVWLEPIIKGRFVARGLSMWERSNIKNIVFYGIPSCSFIGGIFILRLKEWSRKFIIATFLAGFILKIVSVPIIFVNLKGEYGILGVIWSLLCILDILIIFYFIRPKVKEQFR